MDTRFWSTVPQKPVGEHAMDITTILFPGEGGRTERAMVGQQ